MSLGGLGIVSVILSFFAFIKKEYILLISIFFAPYCASCVFDFRYFFLQPGHYFFFLYLIISSVVIFKSNFKIKFAQPNLFLLNFVILSLVSIILSWLIGIDEPVYGIGNKVQLKSSLVSIQNFTQYLYLIVGFCFYISVKNYMVKSIVSFNTVLKIFYISGISVLLIGVYQIIAFEFSLPYDEVFRNSVKDMWQTKERVQSTMGEASFLGQYCVYLLGFYLSYKNINGFVRTISLFLTISIGVLSRSSTFLFGATLVVIIYVLLQKKTLRNVITYLCGFIFTIVLISGLYIYTEKMQLLINSTIDKLTMVSWSGIERSFVFHHMLDIGISYPILGIGYGGGRSTDLYANLFSTVGIFGLVSFLGFVFSMLYKMIKNKDIIYSQMCILFLVGFLITSCSMPDISYLPLWLIFALCDSSDKYIKLFRRTEIC